MAAFPSATFSRVIVFAEKLPSSFSDMSMFPTIFFDEKCPLREFVIEISPVRLSDTLMFPTIFFDEKCPLREFVIEISPVRLDNSMLP